MTRSEREYLLAKRIVQHYVNIADRQKKITFYKNEYYVQLYIRSSKSLKNLVLLATNPEVIVPINYQNNN